MSSTVIREASAYAIAKTVPGAIGLAAVTILIRVVGPQEYGRYALLFALATLGGVLSSTWLSQSVLRLSPQAGLGPADLHRVRWQFGAGSFGLGSVVLAIGMTASGIADPWSAACSAALLVGFHLYSVELAVLQSGLKARRIAGIEVVRAAFMLLLPLVIALAIHSDGTALLAGAALAYWCAWALLTWYRPRQPGDCQPVQHPLRFGTLLRFGLPLSAWAGASQGLSVIDRYVVAAHLGDAAVGGYAAMYDVVVRGFAMLMFPITMAVHPRIMRHVLAGQREQARRLLKHAIFAQCALGLLVIPAGFALRHVLAERILGLSYDEFGGLVLPLLVGSFLWQAALLVHKPLEIAFATRHMLAGMALALGVALLVNVLLVPRFGLVGAALSLPGSALAYISFVMLVQTRADRESDRPGATDVHG